MVRLGNIIQNSTVDWLGHVSIVYLFAGCNLRCGFCYNHKLIPLDSGTEYPDEYMKEAIDENVVNDAVMATGGEPTLQPKSVEYLFDYAKKAGLLTVLNTNGTNAMPIVDLHEKGLLDHVAMDIKAPLNPMEYRTQTGMKTTDYLLPAGIRATMQMIKRLGIPLEIRTTVVPKSYSCTVYFPAIINDIKDYTDEFHIQQFVSADPYDPLLKGLEPVDKSVLCILGNWAKAAGIKKVVIVTNEEPIYIT